MGVGGWVGVGGCGWVGGWVVNTTMTFIKITFSSK